MKRVLILIFIMSITFCYRNVITAKDLSSSEIKELLDYAMMKNDPELNFEIGHSYHYGQSGFQKDSRKAIEWYSKAALKTHHQAQIMLALIYMDQSDKTLTNYREALNWLQMAVTNHNSSDAKGLMAQIYLDGGYGVSPDLSKGISLLEEESKSGSSDASYQLAMLYAGRGNKVERDVEKVKLFINLASEQGHPAGPYYAERIANGEIESIIAEWSK